MGFYKFYFLIGAMLLKESVLAPSCQGVQPDNTYFVSTYFVLAQPQEIPCIMTFRITIE